MTKYLFMLSQSLTGIVQHLLILWRLIMTTVKWERELTMTEPEESVLVKMAQFFIENGWVDPDTEKEFDTLIEKICEPAPWDYACFEVDS